jgi:VanZ family protein
VKLLGSLLVWAFAIPALWRVRWAYIVFVVLGLLYLPATTGFQVNPQRCDLTFNTPVLIQSLTNYPHIILFSFFFLVTMRQFHLSDWRSWAWSVGLTMAMGAALEIAEALSGLHHCKTVDLVPDFIGALLGVIIAILARRVASSRRSRRNGNNGSMKGDQIVL